RREVTRVVTPGTITEDDLFDPRQNNHVAALCPGPAHTATGGAWLELSTGQLHAADIPWARLTDELARLAPAECLCSEGDADLVADLLARLPSPFSLTKRPDWTFDPASARAAL